MNLRATVFVGWMLDMIATLGKAVGELVHYMVPKMK